MDARTPRPSVAAFGVFTCTTSVLLYPVYSGGNHEAKKMRRRGVRVLFRASTEECHPGSVLPFRMVFFYLVTTLWIFDISLREISTNQSNKHWYTRSGGGQSKDEDPQKHSTLVLSKKTQAQISNSSVRGKSNLVENGPFSAGYLNMRPQHTYSQRECPTDIIQSWGMVIVKRGAY